MCWPAVSSSRLVCRCLDHRSWHRLVYQPGAPRYRDPSSWLSHQSDRPWGQTKEGESLLLRGESGLSLSDLHCCSDPGRGHRCRPGMLSWTEPRSYCRSRAGPSCPARWWSTGSWTSPPGPAGAPPPHCRRSRRRRRRWRRWWWWWPGPPRADICAHHYTAEPSPDSSGHRCSLVRNMKLSVAQCVLLYPPISQWPMLQ